MAWLKSPLPARSGHKLLLELSFPLLSQNRDTTIPDQACILFSFGLLKER